MPNKESIIWIFKGAESKKWHLFCAKTTHSLCFGWGKVSSNHEYNWLIIWNYMTLKKYQKLNERNLFFLQKMAVWQLDQWNDFIPAVYVQCDMATWPHSVANLGNFVEGLLCIFNITYMFLCWFQILVAVNIRLYNWIDRKRIIAHKKRQNFISTWP